MDQQTPATMKRRLTRLRERGRPVAVGELAQRLLAVDSPMDPAVARRVVALALGRPPASLPESLQPGDLRLPGEFEVAGAPLGTAEFAVVDLETTGLEASRSAIIEIGAVRVSNLRSVDRFQTLIRPPVPLPRAIVKLTGIHDAMLADAPTPRRALQMFRGWLDAAPTAPFVAHNAPFDFGFVSRALTDHGFPRYRGPVLCTRKLARRLIPELDRYGLDSLCGHFGISNRARHRALGDADATATALVDLLHLGMERLQLQTVGDLLDLQEKPPAKRKRRRSRR